MEKGKITLHPGAVNLARRYTEMNENDLVMVSSPAIEPKKTDRIRLQIYHSTFSIQIFSLVQQENYFGMFTNCCSALLDFFF